MTASTIVAFLGMGIAYSFYILDYKIFPVTFRSKFYLLYKVIYNKYYIDEIYAFVFIKPCLGLSKLASGFDSGVIDGVVNGAAGLTVIISKVKAWFDLYIIDGIVNLTVQIINLSSRALRLAQTGRVQFYFLIGFSVLVIIMLVKLMGGL